jgi:hypothetical protein
MTTESPVNQQPSSDDLRKELEAALAAGNGPKVARFALQALGAVPIVGGMIGGTAGAWSEKEQAHYNKIFAAWLKLQEDELREIGKTIFEIMGRLDQSDEDTRKRLESPEYLRLLKKSFRDWSAAESEEKRVLIRNLLSNAAATRICSDDVISMFIDWISKFSEAHFAVIREIFKNPGSTRQDVWTQVHGADVREDSAEADLFKLLIYDLSTGHVIRQHREKDRHGNFIVRSRTGQRQATRSGPRPATSAFDDDKQYELTELGKQFVHYTMNEIVPRIATPSATPPPSSAPPAG